MDLFLGIWPMDAGGIFISMCVTLDSHSIMTFLIIYWIPFKLVQHQTVALSLNGSFLAAYSTNEQAKRERYNCFQYLASEYDSHCLGYTDHIKSRWYVLGYFWKSSFLLVVLSSMWCTKYVKETQKKQTWFIVIENQ